MTASFILHGHTPPTSPVVLSVPHAGRDYPAALRAALAVPFARVVALEDRHVDTLALAARGEEATLVQGRARAWIDLNRAEDERDPQIDAGAAAVPQGNARLRNGLGLVPRRAAGAGSLWRGRFADADIRARIAADHRPYHAALAELLSAARRRFGIAVLLDVHSMPPLTSGARLVIGDRFGRSAAARFVARVEGAAGRLPHALNAPYAGGHILTRHAAPAHGIHALQLEIDRTLYLDPSGDAPGAGFAATARMLHAVIAALADEALAGGIAQAAE